MLSLEELCRLTLGRARANSPAFLCDLKLPPADDGNSSSVSNGRIDGEFVDQTPRAGKAQSQSPSGSPAVGHCLL
jgi:hypothetical protein